MVATMLTSERLRLGKSPYRVSMPERYMTKGSLVMSTLCDCSASVMMSKDLMTLSLPL